MAGISIFREAQRETPTKGDAGGRALAASIFN